MFDPAFKALTTKSSNSRQWLASATLVMFLLVQFVTAVHAAEHAFHQEKSYCAALNNVENNKLLSCQVSGFRLTNIVAEVVATLFLQDVEATLTYSYHSRAPPENIV